MEVTREDITTLNARLDRYDDRLRGEMRQGFVEVKEQIRDLALVVRSQTETVQDNRVSIQGHAARLHKLEHDHAGNLDHSGYNENRRLTQRDFWIVFGTIGSIVAVVRFAMFVWSVLGPSNGNH